VWCGDTFVINIKFIMPIESRNYILNTYYIDFLLETIHYYMQVNDIVMKWGNMIKQQDLEKH